MEVSVWTITYVINDGIKTKTPKTIRNESKEPLIDNVASDILQITKNYLNYYEYFPGTPHHVAPSILMLPLLTFTLFVPAMMAKTTANAKNHPAYT